MFSGSSSFLGGGPSARGPGQPQQQQQQYGQQQPMQGFGGLQPQPTGFGGGPLQPQFTGYPGQQQAFQQPQQQPPQLQPQFTGYPGQQQQSFQQPPQQQSFQQAPQQQPFQTGQQSMPPPAQPQRPQLTGMTSSQMADSFRGPSSQPQQPQAPQPTGSKIPSIRLSFITAQDQTKFEQLFKSAVGNGQAMSGDQARDLLMRSKLSGDALAHIW